MRVAVVLATFAACASPAPPPPPPAPPAPPPVPLPPAPSEPPRADPPVHDCGQDPVAETPIASGTLGEGDRVVRLINNAAGTIQARILHENLEAALPGTLVVEAGGRGEFHVPEGVYRVRYRYGTSCEVRRGRKLILTGPRAGVEIAIAPQFEEGESSNMERVTEPL